jgi:phage terminase large subunit GpA-like protein
VPCPHCGERQHLKWANVRWQKTGQRVTRAAYICEECGAEIEEHHKPAMLTGGRWLAENHEAPWRSYHISAIYSPIGLGLSWVELAEEWIEAQDDPAKLMRFVNTRLGETWADRSHEVKPNLLAARAEPYPLRHVPRGALVLTAGIDTQDDRLEVRIMGWGAGEKEWTIDYHVIHGNPAEERVWNALDDYLTAEFTNDYGRALRIEASAIDTGGHHTHAVYAYVRRAKARRLIAIKGASTTGRVILGKPSHQDVNWRGQTIKKGVALYTVGADTAKHWIYNRINGDNDKDPGERKVHYSQELEPWFYDQQVSETFNPRKNRWELKKGKRNEVLDTHVYAIAASHHPELYLHKWKAADWKRRAAMLEPDEIPAFVPTPAQIPPPPTHKGRPRRRVVSR